MLSHIAVFFFAAMAAYSRASAPVRMRRAHTGLNRLSYPILVIVFAMLWAPSEAARTHTANAGPLMEAEEAARTHSANAGPLMEAEEAQATKTGASLFEAEADSSPRPVRSGSTMIYPPEKRKLWPWRSRQASAEPSTNTTQGRKKKMSEATNTQEEVPSRRFPRGFWGRRHRDSPSNNSRSRVRTNATSSEEKAPRWEEEQHINNQAAMNTASVFPWGQ